MTNREPGQQTKLRRRAACALMLAVLGFGLAGCGKKPSVVDPPPDVTDDTFPRTYPDPATDPKP